MENKSGGGTNKINEIPLNTSSKIIINSNIENYAFDKGTYREDYLNHIIEKNEYENILVNASKIMGNSWVKKRINDQIKLPKNVIILSIISIVLVIIYMILLYLSIFSENGKVMIIISIVCVTISSMIALGLSIYNISRKLGKFKSLEQIIKVDLDGYLKEINKKYEGRLVFSYHEVNRWIECNILKKKNEDDYSRKNNVIKSDKKRLPKLHTMANSKNGDKIKDLENKNLGKMQNFQSSKSKTFFDNEEFKTIEMKLINKKDN